MHFRFHMKRCYILISTPNCSLNGKSARIGEGVLGHVLNPQYGDLCVPLHIYATGRRPTTIIGFCNIALDSGLNKIRHLMFYCLCFEVNGNRRICACMIPWKLESDKQLFKSAQKCLNIAKI